VLDLPPEAGAPPVGALVDAPPVLDVPPTGARPPVAVAALDADAPPEFATPPVLGAPAAVDVVWLLLLAPPTLELPADVVAALLAELPAVPAVPPLLDAPPVLLATLDLPPVALFDVLPPLDFEPPTVLPASEVCLSLGSPLEHAMVQVPARHKNSHAGPREAMWLRGIGAAVFVVG